MTIKAVVFDMGGVYFTNGMEAIAERLSQDFGVDPDKAREVLDNGELGRGYRCGLIGYDEFWHRAMGEMGLDGDHNEISRMWNESYTPIEGTVKVIADLRKRVKVAYLTNSVPDRVDYLDKRYGFKDDFDCGVASFETGIRKPDPRAWELILDKLGMAAKEVVFVDDKQRNIDAAGELGFGCILFESAGQLRKELEALGVL